MAHLLDLLALLMKVAWPTLLRVRGWAIWWLCPPDPICDGTLEKAEKDVQGIDFDSFKDHLNELMRDAKETLAQAQATTERIDRKCFTLLPIGLSLVTAIVAAVGIGSLDFWLAAPSLTCAMFAAIEVAISLQPATVAILPDIDEQLRAAERKEWPEGIINNLHVAVAFHRASQNWRTGHLSLAIWGLIAAVGLLIIPAFFAAAVKAGA